MSTTADRPPQAFSCIRCFERKVKCDKLNPACSNCTQANVKCISRVPPAPRPRRKRPPDAALLARLKGYEELLKNNGISFEGMHSPSVSSAVPTPSTSSPLHEGADRSYDINRHPAFLAYQDSQAGQLLVDHGKSRFIENNLWVSASSEFQPKEAIIEHCSDEEDEDPSRVEETTDFMFGYSPSSNSMQHFHPSSDQILVLWEVFLENVNPMTKLLHQPTLQETLTRASTHLGSLTKGLEALMFSIYTAAVTSMNDDDCEMQLGENRKVLLSRYRYATRTSLARARFMATSEIQVLQAFTLYLLMMRKEDSRTTWALAGVASRIAQQMGLHRDGTTLGVSPFETEMRRRLWWQISMLDFNSAELSGSGRYREFTLSDTRAPSNVDDVDLHPGMEAPPSPQAKATEMIAYLLRYEFSAFWKEKVVEKVDTTLENMRFLIPHVTTPEERDSRVNELERRIEEKYLRYCDPTIPVQFMSILIGRATIDSMRLMSQCGQKYLKRENMSPSKQELLWNLCIKLIESDNLAHSTKMLQRFRWHNDVHFHWHALIYLLHELGTHPQGPKVDKTWDLLNDLFANHPDFITNSRKPLHVAVGSLCVKAYNAREATLREKTNGLFPKATPEYILLLRQQRQRSSAAIPEDARAEVTSELRSQTQLAAKTYINTSQHLPASQRLASPQRQARLPLSPPFQDAGQVRSISSDEFVFASDPELSQDLAMAGIPMDWMQWDYITQDLDEGISQIT